MSVITRIGNNLYQLELIPDDEPGRTTSYLITEDINVLIETGASPSNGKILEGLSELGLKPDQIGAVIVTHIHLDHSGGAGLLLTQCPDAKLYVHQKGKKHLVEPDALISGARELYKDKFQQMFEPILPVPEERIKSISEGERLKLSENRELIFYETPGHALHHLVVFDSATRGIFTGDAVGMYYQQIDREFGQPICIPSTAPPQFDPIATEESLDKMLALSPEKLYFTHYGTNESANELLENLKKRIPFFAGECVTFYQKHRDETLLYDFIHNHWWQEFLKLRVDPNLTGIKAHLKYDCMLNANGIVAYVNRLEK